MAQQEIGVFETWWAICGLILYIFLFSKNHSPKWKYVLVGLLPFMARSYYLVSNNSPIRNLTYLLEGMRGGLYSKFYLDRYKLLTVFAATTLLPLINIDGFFETINQVLFSVGVFLAIGYASSAYKDITNGEHISDHILITIIAMSWIYKITYGYQLGVNPLMVRGGGVYASNQVISIILILLPFSRNRWFIYSAIITILLQFSRGGIFALLILFIIYNLQLRNKIFKIKGTAIKSSILVGLVAYGLLLIASFFSNIDIFDFITLRMLGGGAYGLDISLIESLSFDGTVEILDQVYTSLMNDDRFLIWNKALEIVEESNYFGVGTGNFNAYALKFDMGLEYSNAHNLFLTILVEQGVLALLLFVSTLTVYIKRAYKYSSNGFSSLVVFCIYGMYSGQIYEVSFENTITQYIVLLIVFAHIDAKFSNVRKINVG